MVDRASGHPWAADPSIVVEIQAARERHEAERKEKPAAAQLHVVDPTIFQGQPLPERRWIVPDWVPQDVVTGLYGVGGIGKSLLAQQLMTATALGRDWLGLPVKAVNSLGFFCEDAQDELHRRQADINHLYGCDFADLGNMRWLPRFGEDNILVQFREGVAIMTALFDQLLAEALEFGAQLVIVDTMFDAFAGNQNDAGQARQFVQAGLGRIAREIGGAVVACGHPSRAGQSSSTGDSGSVQWDAAFRSRLYLTTPESAERDERVLTRKKSNYAPRDETVELRWNRGVFVPPKLPGGGFFGTADGGKRRTAEEVFLDLLEALTSEGRSVSESVHAGNYAPRLFAQRPDRDGFNKVDFQQAMERLFARREISVEPYRQNRNQCSRIIATPNKS